MGRSQLSDKRGCVWDIQDTLLCRNKFLVKRALFLVQRCKSVAKFVAAMAWP